MIQIISYEEKSGILTAGFKVDDFVVYSSIPYDSSKTKQQLSQLAYQQIKQTIGYEKTLTTHGLTTNKTGEVFTPERPKLKSIQLILGENNVRFEENQKEITITAVAIGLDQYNEPINITPTFKTSYGVVKNGVIIIPKAEKAIEITISANFGDVKDSKKILVSPYEEYFENKIIKSLNNIEARQNGLEGTQNNLVDDSNEIFNYLLEYEFKFSMLELGLTI